jgi:hypothetical protein
MIYKDVYTVDSWLNETLSVHFCPPHAYLLGRPVENVKTMWSVAMYIIYIYNSVYY